MTRQLVALAGLIVFSLVCAGCEPTTTDDKVEKQDDHGHEEIESFADGVAQLKTLHASIRDTIKDDGDADEALHEAGHLLEHLPDFVGKAGLDEEGATSAKEAIEKMMDAYGEVDEAVHKETAGVSSVYEGVSATLDEAMSTLDGLAGD